MEFLIELYVAHHVGGAFQLEQRIIQDMHDRTWMVLLDAVELAAAVSNVPMNKNTDTHARSALVDINSYHIHLRRQILTSSSLLAYFRYKSRRSD